MDPSCSDLLLPEPWRSMPENSETRDYVGTRDFKDVKHLRILLLGPTGAGKSSFINSVSSALQGKVTVGALTDATVDGIYTKRHTSHKIPCGPGSSYLLSFTDGMCFGHKGSRGVSVTDAVLALKGHIKEGYMFSPNNPITEDHLYYNKSPTKKDIIHVLVFVVSAHTVNVLSDELLERMRDVRLAASQLGIPQLTILTKVDEACPEVQKNIGNIYRSKHLEETVGFINVQLGFQRNCIFLVKNYESEINTDPGVDAPILCALRQIVSYGEDFVSNMNREEGERTAAQASQFLFWLAVAAAAWAISSMWPF